MKNTKLKEKRKGVGEVLSFCDCSTKSNDMIRLRILYNSNVLATLLKLCQVRNFWKETPTTDTALLFIITFY